MRARRKQVSAEEKGIRVISDIKPGPASPTQAMAWRRFWAKLISEVKDEVREEQQRNQS